MLQRLHFVLGGEVGLCRYPRQRPHCSVELKRRVAERGRRSRGGHLRFVWCTFQVRIKSPSRPCWWPPSFLPRLEQTSTIGLVMSTCLFSFRLSPLLPRLESGTSRARMTEPVCRSLWRPTWRTFLVSTATVWHCQVASRQFWAGLTGPLTPGCPPSPIACHTRLFGPCPLCSPLASTGAPQRALVGLTYVCTHSKSNSDVDGTVVKSQTTARQWKCVQPVTSMGWCNWLLFIIIIIFLGLTLSLSGARQIILLGLFQCSRKCPPYICTLLFMLEGPFKIVTREHCFRKERCENRLHELQMGTHLQTTLCSHLNGTSTLWLGIKLGCSFLISFSVEFLWWELNMLNLILVLVQRATICSSGYRPFLDLLGLFMRAEFSFSTSISHRNIHSNHQRWVTVLPSNNQVVQKIMKSWGYVPS